MICYFRESLKLFIKVEIEQQDQKSMNFEEMMQKAVNAEAKAGLRPSIIVRDLNTCYPKSHRPSHNTSSKMQIQGSNHKHSPCSKESKSKDLKSAPPRSNMAEPAKKEGEKKKKSQGHKRKRIGE